MGKLVKKDKDYEIIKCDNCNGEGKIADKQCSKCHGTGKISLIKS
jgi:DnaJ-class molecular chaperone